MKKLPEQQQQAIIDLYSSRYEEHGEDVTTVGWSNSPDQLLRFKELLRGIDINNKTILDIGCGLGDIIPYLDTLSDNSYRYIGIDITESLVAHAQNKYADREYFKFISGEFLSHSPHIECDISILSGCLNFNMNGCNVEYTKSVMGKMFAASKEVAALNMFSSYVDYTEERHFHYSPEEMFSHAKSLTRHVNLNHAYPLWEFTLQLFKESHV